MKVILVESDLIGRLETLVNGAIEKFTPERVVDIKYSSAIDGRSHEHYYSAMVILDVNDMTCEKAITKYGGNEHE